MKKHTLLILTVLISNLIFTQNKFQYGLYTGLNLSNFRGSDAENYNTKAGFHLGLLLESKVLEKTTIETGVYFSQMGTKFSETTTSFDLDGYHSLTGGGTYKLNYLRIPILIKYYPIENLSFGVGTDIGINVVRNFKYDSHINSGAEFEDISIQGVDAGVKAKTSYKFLKHYYISVDYYHGLIKTYKNSNIIYPTHTEHIKAPNIYNANFSLSLGYIF